MAALFVLLLVVIICATVLFGMYIHYCAESNVGLFEKTKYNERISKLEERIREVEKKL